MQIQTSRMDDRLISFGSSNLSTGAKSTGPHVATNGDNTVSINEVHEHDFS